MKETMQNAKTLLEHNFQNLQSAIAALDTERAKLEAGYLAQKKFLETVPENLDISKVADNPYCADMCLTVGDLSQLNLWLAHYPPEPCVALTDGRTFKPVRCLRENEEVISEAALPYELKGMHLLWWSTVGEKSVQILAPNVDTIDFVMNHVDLGKFEPVKRSYPFSSLRVWISRKKRYEDLMGLTRRFDAWFKVWDEVLEVYGTNEKRRQYLRTLLGSVKHSVDAKTAMQRIATNHRMASHHLAFGEDTLKELAERYDNASPLYHQGVEKIHADLEEISSWLKEFFKDRGRPQLRRSCAEILQYLLARDLKHPVNVGSVQMDINKDFFEVMVQLGTFEKLVQVPFDVNAPAFDLRTMEEYF